MEIKLGRYKHFKGDTMRVIGVAKHSETEEDYVVYDHLGTDARSNLWIRPVKMFLEEVDRDGYKGPRFVWVGE